jgi:antitoxin (DNA-binding transcriptional repressor) of toxin-antitoxin stability system
MLSANVAELKNHLSQYLTLLESGETVEICKRNIPIAMLIPTSVEKTNMTQLGCARGSVKINCDLTEPAIPEGDWNMLDGNL